MPTASLPACVRARRDVCTREQDIGITVYKTQAIDTAQTPVRRRITFCTVTSLSTTAGLWPRHALAVTPNSTCYSCKFDNRR